MKLVKKFFLIGLDFPVYRVVGGIIDEYLLSPLIILKFNFIISLLILFATTLLMYYIFIRLYDRSKKDFLFIEALKNAESGLGKNQQNLIIKKISKLTKKSRFVLIPALISWDPFITAVYLRDGSYKWNGIPSKKVFWLFFASAFSCNLIWVIILEGGVFLKELLF